MKYIIYFSYPVIMSLSKMSLRLHGNVSDDNSSNNSLLEHDKRLFVDMCRTMSLSLDLPVIVTSSTSGSSVFSSSICNIYILF